MRAFFRLQRQLSPVPLGSCCSSVSHHDSCKLICEKVFVRVYERDIYMLFVYLNASIHPCAFLVPLKAIDSVWHSSPEMSPEVATKKKSIEMTVVTTKSIPLRSSGALPQTKCHSRLLVMILAIVAYVIWEAPTSFTAWTTKANSEHREQRSRNETKKQFKKT